MGYSMDDAMRGAHDAELGDEYLTVTESAAEELAAKFNDDHVSNGLRPRLEPTLTVGGDDQPLFAFTLGVALEADFDPRLYPSGPINDLIADARRRIEGSPVDDWEWLVSVNVLDATTKSD